MIFSVDAALEIFDAESDRGAYALKGAFGISYGVADGSNMGFSDRVVVLLPPAAASSVGLIFLEDRPLKEIRQNPTLATPNKDFDAVVLEIPWKGVLKTKEGEEEGVALCVGIDRGWLERIDEALRKETHSEIKKVVPAEMVYQNYLSKKLSFYDLPLAVVDFSPHMLLAILFADLEGNLIPISSLVLEEKGFIEQLRGIPEVSGIEMNDYMGMWEATKAYAPHRVDSLLKKMAMDIHNAAISVYNGARNKLETAGVEVGEGLSQRPRVLLSGIPVEDSDLGQRLRDSVRSAYGNVEVMGDLAGVPSLFHRCFMALKG